MKKKKPRIDFNFLENEESIISRIKWEALRRNPDYIKFVNEWTDTVTGRLKSDIFVNRTFNDGLDRFGIIRCLRPDIADPTDDYRTLFQEYFMSPGL